MDFSIMILLLVLLRILDSILVELNSTEWHLTLVISWVESSIIEKKIIFQQTSWKKKLIIFVLICIVKISLLSEIISQKKAKRVKSTYQDNRQIVSDAM